MKSSSHIGPAPLTSLVTTDLTGITRGRSVLTSTLNDHWTVGCGWVPANSALTPQGIIADQNPWGSRGDLCLLPDRKSRVQVGNGPDAEAPAMDFVHCDLIETDGRPWDCCPRTLLRNEIDRYEHRLGIQAVASFEHEFTLTGLAAGLGHGSAFSLRAQRQAAKFSSWLIAALDAAGVQPEMFLPEYGKSQYEVTCHATRGVAAADRAVTVREITFEIARQMSLQASFSPHTAVDAVNNGVHLHISLYDLDGEAILYEAGRQYNLSLLGEHWAAGVLHHLPALCALTAPTPVSYLRLKPHHWSTAYGCLGYRNREAALRICPTVSLGKKSVADQYNLEYRPLDATASPHLAMAAILISGRLGIEKQLPLKAVCDTDPHELNAAERESRSIFELPQDLTTALEMLSNDKELLQVLPKSLVDTYFSLKRQELELTKELDDTTICENYALIY